MKIETPIIILLVVMFVGIGAVVANNCDNGECGGGGGGGGLIYNTEATVEKTTQVNFIKINIADIIIFTVLFVIVYELYLIYCYVKELKEMRR